MYVPCVRFKEGLSTLGVLAALRSYPELLKPLMCCGPVVDLTADSLENLFKPKLSPSGCNERTVENRVYAWFLDYLQTVAGKK